MSDYDIFQEEQKRLWLKIVLRLLSLLLLLLLLIIGVY